MYVHIAAEFKIVCDGLTVTSDIQFKQGRTLNLESRLSDTRHSDKGVATQLKGVQEGCRYFSNSDLLITHLAYSATCLLLL